jgi:hypothetical protein
MRGSSALEDAIDSFRSVQRGISLDWKGLPKYLLKGFFYATSPLYIGVAMANRIPRLEVEGSLKDIQDINTSRNILAGMLSIGGRCEIERLEPIQFPLFQSRDPYLSNAQIQYDVYHKILEQYKDHPDFDKIEDITRLEIERIEELFPEIRPYNEG